MNSYESFIKSTSSFKNIFSSWRVYSCKIIPPLFFLIITCFAQAQKQVDQDIPADELEKMKIFEKAAVHQWFQNNLKATILFHTFIEAPYGQKKEEIQRVFQNAEKEDFFTDLAAQIPDINVGLGIGISPGSNLELGIESTASPEKLVRWYYENKISYKKNKSNWPLNQMKVLDYTNAKLSKNQISHYAEILVESIYDCKVNQHCFLKSDPGYWYLYQNIFKNNGAEKHKLWSTDYPTFEYKDFLGRTQQMSLEEMMIAQPELATLIGPSILKNQTEDMAKGFDGMSEEMNELQKILGNQTNLFQLELEEFYKKRDSQSRKNTNIKQTEEIKKFRQNLVDQGFGLAKKNEDPKLYQLQNDLRVFKSSDKSLQEQLEKGEITKGAWEEKNNQIKVEINNQEKKITVYKFESEITNMRSWTKTIIFSAQMLGAPKEFIQFGNGVAAGLNIMEGIGSILITGVIDPTGITLALAGISALVTIFGDPAPDINQIILSRLDKIYENQVKMMESLNRLEFSQQEIKEELYKIQSLLKEIKAENRRATKDILYSLKLVNHNINHLSITSTKTDQILLNAETRNADIQNKASKNPYQASLNERYQRCYTIYESNRYLSKYPANSGEEGVLHYNCLSDCISQKIKNNDSNLSSCGNRCSVHKHANCDSNCVTDIIGDIKIAITVYDNCKTLIDDHGSHILNSQLTGIYEHDFLTFDKYPYIIGARENQISIEQITTLLDGHNISTRVNTFSRIVDSMNNQLSYFKKNRLDHFNKKLKQELMDLNTLQKKYDLETLDQKRDDSKQNLRQELMDSNTQISSIEEDINNFKSFISSNKKAFKNPDHLDDTFKIYVDSMSRLPSKNTFIKKDESKYSYQLNHLSNMCVDLQKINILSQQSRENIQNAFVLIYDYLDDFIQEAELLFARHIFEEIDKLKEIDVDSTNSKKEKTDPSKTKVCDCQKDYTKVSTGILNDIQNGINNRGDNNQKSPLVEFFNNSDGILENTLNQLSDLDIEKKGFEIISYYENRCHEYKYREEVRVGKVDNPQQLKMLKDTFEAVRKSDAQGGCWFIDKFGLITGRKGERIQLYQNTGLDIMGNPAPEPLCAVFVTSLQHRWFMFWDWSEPVSRAICLEAELEFFDAGATADESFFEKQSRSRMYYLTEDELRNQMEPRPLSALNYVTNIIKLICPECDTQGLKEGDYEHIKEQVRKYDEDHPLSGGYLNEVIECSKELDGIYSDYTGSILCSPNTVRSLMDLTHYTIDKIFAERVSEKWITDYNMLIDTYDIETGIGKKQWVANMYRNRDSFGRCRDDKFACLIEKDAPVYVADRKGWKTRAEEEMKNIRRYIQRIIKKGSTMEDEKGKDEQYLSSSFSEVINQAFNSWYNITSLIEAGYGDQLEINVSLAPLKSVMDEISQTVKGIEIPSSTDAIFNENLRRIKKLHIILKKVIDRLKEEHMTQSTLDRLIPVVSSEKYGLGSPEKRSQAIDKLWEDINKTVDIDSDIHQCRKEIIFDQEVF